MGPGRPARPTHTTLISQNTEETKTKEDSVTRWPASGWGPTFSPGLSGIHTWVQILLDHCWLSAPPHKPVSLDKSGDKHSTPLPTHRKPWWQGSGGHRYPRQAACSQAATCKEVITKRQSPEPSPTQSMLSSKGGHWSLGTSKAMALGASNELRLPGGSSRTKNAGLGDSRRRQAGSWGAGVVGRTFPPFLANLIPVSHCTPQCTSLAQRPVSLQEVGVEVPSLWQRLKDRGGWGSQAAVRVKT